MPKSKRSAKRRAKLKKTQKKAVKWARRRYKRYLDALSKAVGE